MQRTLTLNISFSLKHFFVSVAISTQVASAPLKSLPSCYLKPTLNSYNFTSLLSAWILFLSFCNIAVNLGLLICGLLRLSNCFPALRYSWIIPSKIITNCLLFILASRGELFFGKLIQLLLVCRGYIEINPSPKTKNQIQFCHWNLNGLAAHNFTKVSPL